MAGGWTRDGAVQDQIEDTVKDAVLRARAQLAAGKRADPQAPPRSPPWRAHLRRLPVRTRLPAGFRRHQPPRQQGQPAALNA